MSTSAHSLHFLCVGLCPEAIGTLLTRPDAVNFTLDICGSVLDAQEKMKSASYDLYIIDSSASAIIDEVRKKKGVIALVQENADESQKAHYILEKAHLKEQMDAMLKALQGPHKSKMPELKRKYDEAIPEKIEHLQELVRASHQNPDRILEFKTAIHKISGSAGSFGYSTVSSLCKDTEVEINRRIADGTYKDREWISSLHERVKRIKEEFQSASFEESPLVAPIVDKKPLIYVVDDDVPFLDLLERIKDAFSLELMLEFDPEKAIAQLQSLEFKPDGLVASQTFPLSRIKGLDIIKKKFPSQISVLLLDKDSIETRVEAMQSGIDYVFNKPISAYQLLKVLSDALTLKPLGSPRVLIVDDDEDFCNYASAVLEESNIACCAIHGSEDLFNKLEEFRPNILLLDILLPKYDGLNLLKALRQDVNYKNLAIVLVTGSEESETRLAAYANNADDILFKPIDKNILQKRIQNIAARRNTNIDSENYTGLLHLPELKEELNEALHRTPGHDYFLVLFEVHDFSGWTKKHGHSATKDLMILISNQLQWETDSRMKCFWYKSSIFAILFEGVEFETIEKKMHSFLSYLVQTKPEWHLSFDCGIVPISKNFSNASDALEAAERCFAQAGKQESDTFVNIGQCVPKGGISVKKEVVIIDPNPDLLKILKQAFESHGLQVMTFVEGNDALQELLSRKEHTLPSLVIVERKLPDMDGLDVFLKLKSRFKSQIPFFILTVFAADKDISEGIRQGVLEYIVKPFNISILVQKALQIIFK